MAGAPQFEVTLHLPLGASLRELRAEPDRTRIGWANRRSAHPMNINGRRSVATYCGYDAAAAAFSLAVTTAAGGHVLESAPTDPFPDLPVTACSLGCFPPLLNV